MLDTPYNYAIVGENDDDGDELPMFWNELKGWGDFKQATLFNSNILHLPLPPRGVAILDIRTIETSWNTTLPAVGAGIEWYAPTDILLADMPRFKARLNQIEIAIKELKVTFDKP
jgi:hypothetical protein